LNRSGRRFETVRVVLLAVLVVGMAVSISLAELTLTALVVWLLLARWAGVVVSLRWPLWLPIVVFSAWSFVAALASEHPRESVLALKGLLTLADLFVLVNALPNAASARRFATWLVLALAGTAVLAIVQVAACPGPAAVAHATTLTGKFLRKCVRARAFYSIYMTLAGVLTMALVAALPRLARFDADVRWLGPAWGVSGAALALTYVRGAWVGFAAGAMAAAAGLGRRGIAAIVLLLALGGALVAALPSVRARLETIPDPSNPTARERIVMMKVGLQMAKTHPVAGVGPGGVKRFYPQMVPPEGIRQHTSHLHNSPLQILAERGLVGLAAWLWLFGAFFRRAGVILARLPTDAAGDRALVLGSLAAIVAFLVAGLFEYSFGDTEVLMVALAIMAVPFALAEDRGETGPGPRGCNRVFA
jgi:O-antigen ligase